MLPRVSDSCKLLVDGIAPRSQTAAGVKGRKRGKERSESDCQMLSQGDSFGEMGGISWGFAGSSGEGAGWLARCGAEEEDALVAQLG